MTLSVPLRKYEQSLGLLYLFIYFLVLPELLTMLNSFLKLEAWALNVIFFVVNFLAIAIIFQKFLTSSFRVAMENPWRCVKYAGQGLLLYYISAFILGFLIMLVKPDFINLNDQNVLQMAQGQKALFTLCTVILVPITEETLFRGVLFRGLFDKSKVLAYIVPTLLFAAIHVVGYIGRGDWLTLLLSFIQYLPAGLSLAYAYHRSDTIWAAILTHIAVNQIGMSLGGL